MRGCSLVVSGRMVWISAGSLSSAGARFSCGPQPSCWHPLPMMDIVVPSSLEGHLLQDPHPDSRVPWGSGPLCPPGGGDMNPL